MKKQPNESAAAGEDLISDLPDEILHSVLRRIPYFKEAAQTSALSSRWRNLWSSYPVVELDSATSPYYTSHSASPFYPLCTVDKHLMIDTLHLPLKVVSNVQ
ncbi:F-box/FBD/LRR-repeat protein At2g04230 [Linum perenne]